MELDCTIKAFYQSQLANVLSMRSLAKNLSSKNITVNAVYPGVVMGTSIRRNMENPNPNPWSPVQLNASEGAYTAVFLLHDRSVANMTGKMFWDMAEMALAENGLDEVAGQQLQLIDEYWTDLKTMEQLEQINSGSS